MSPFVDFFAQATNAVTPVNPVDAAAQQRSPWFMILAYPLLGIMFYYAFFRPTIQAKKKQADSVNTAKTGDRVVTSSGIHGVVTNVKDGTFIVKVADNVKLEIDKNHIEKITRAESPVADKAPAAKAS